MRTCQVDNCISVGWGTDKNTGILYCLSHQWKRTDKKPKRAILRHSERKPVHTIHFGFDDQLSMFEWLWEQAKDKRGRVICQFTNIDITEMEHGNVEAWICCFLHILCKKNWPYFKLCPDGVVIGHPDFHRIVDCGTMAERNKHPDWKWDVWDQKVIETKQKYFEFKKKNLLS